MFEREAALPSPEEILEELPLPNSLKPLVKARDGECKAALSGESGKLIFLVGPCSAHDPDAVAEYAGRLGKLQSRVADKLVLVPRIYTSKPRSRGIGYKGLLFQSDPNARVDLPNGIRAARKLHLRCLEESGLAAADEMLFPENLSYFEDLLCYHALGARSAEDALHRFVASGLSAAVGVKNPLSGSLKELADSVCAARAPQTFCFHGWQVRTEGNPYAHAVLRGGVNAGGEDVPNCGGEDLLRLLEEFEKDGLTDPAVIVDASHSNSGKRFDRQPRIVAEVLRERARDGRLRKFVKGFMVESFLAEGAQTENAEFGKSVTDPCLGWEATERLILDVADQV